MDDGRCRPLMISCHNFLLMTSTRPPRATTRLYSSYRSSTCLAMIGKRVIGVPIFFFNKTKPNNFLFISLRRIFNQKEPHTRAGALFKLFDHETNKRRRFFLGIFFFSLLSRCFIDTKNRWLVFIYSHLFFFLFLFFRLALATWKKASIPSSYLIRYCIYVVRE